MSRHVVVLMEGEAHRSPLRARRRRGPTAVAVLHVMLISGVLPNTTASAQGLPRIAVDPGVPTPPTELATRCAAETELADDFLTALSEALAQAEEEVVRGSLDVLERDARAAALERPDDVEARYRLAAVIGASLEHRSGGSKVSAAKEVHALVVRVLEDAPGHAGARYILGRLHAGVLRLDRVSRFVATRLLGGGALRSASWEEARTLLELSEREDPCVAEHHLELARVYAERGDSAGAARELAHVLEVTRGARGATGPSGSVPSSSAERGVRGSGDRARQQEIPQRRLRHQDARVRGRRRAPWIPRPAGSGIQEVEVTGGGPVSTRTSRVPGGPPLQAG